MKLLRLDSLGGASGDMILGALIDLGIRPSELQQQLEELGLESFQIASEPCVEKGLGGTRASVELTRPAHHARHLSDILTIIGGSKLPDAVKTRAEACFRRLAEAEAAVHRTSPERVHFHEVGAVDAIVDIVGGCLALHLLGVEGVHVGVLPLGSGTVSSDHGLLPVPAPATVALLRDHRVVQTDEPFELVTPTGAVLLTTWQKMLPADLASPASVLATGYGFGSRELAGRANALRATLLETAASPAAEVDACTVLECNLDDCSPELIGALTETLLADGALDVFVTPVQMKKQRPGSLITVLARPADAEELTERLFRESGTFGVRRHATERAVLSRRRIGVETRYGAIRVKIGSRRGEDLTRAPEHEDCRRAAREHQVPLRAVYEAALRALP